MTCENCLLLEAEIKRLRKRYRREHKDHKASRKSLHHHAVGIALMKGTFDHIIELASEFTHRRNKHEKRRDTE